MANNELSLPDAAEAVLGNARGTHSYDGNLIGGICWVCRHHLERLRTALAAHKALPRDVEAMDKWLEGWFDDNWAVTPNDRAKLAASLTAHGVTVPGCEARRLLKRWLSPNEVIPDDHDAIPDDNCDCMQCDTERLLTATPGMTSGEDVTWREFFDLLRRVDMPHASYEKLRDSFRNAMASLTPPTASGHAAQRSGDDKMRRALQRIERTFPSHGGRCNHSALLGLCERMRQIAEDALTAPRPTPDAHGPTCTWTGYEEDEEFGGWESGCGSGKYQANSGPELCDEGYKFCPGCGLRISVKGEESEEEPN